MRAKASLNCVRKFFSFTLYFAYFSLCSVSFVLFRGIYYVTPDHYSLSEKFMKVGGGFDCNRGCGAQTIADNSNKTMQYIFPC